MACFLPVDWADEARITIAMMVVNTNLPWPGELALATDARRYAVVDARPQSLRALADISATRTNIRLVRLAVWASAPLGWAGR